MSKEGEYLIFLNISDYSNEIIPLVNKTNQIRNRFIIENFSNESDEISDFINYETCLFLFKSWENKIQESNLNEEDVFY